MRYNVERICFHCDHYVYNEDNRKYGCRRYKNDNPLISQRRFVRHFGSENYCANWVNAHVDELDRLKDVDPNATVPIFL